MQKPPVTRIMDPASDAAWRLYECERNARRAAGRGLYSQAEAWMAVRYTGAPPNCALFEQKDGLARRTRNPMYQNVGLHVWDGGRSRSFDTTRVTVPGVSTTVYTLEGGETLDVTDLWDTEELLAFVPRLV